MAITMIVAARVIDRLRDVVRGQVITPRDEAYEAARLIWNGAIDRRPAVIARCADAGDVVAAVRCAADAGLRPAVRGGGHSVAGTSMSDGGLVIDLSPMRDVSVDARAMTARVAGGALWSDLDGAAAPFGLATTGGIVSHTGVAGLTLGGGIGWLMRSRALSADNLRAVELVTADGRIRYVDSTRESDLFWALRGGGGNFGVATELEFDVHPVGQTVAGGPIFFALEDAPDLIGFYRDWVAGVPDEMTTILNFRRAPAAAFLPPALHGRPVVGVVTCFGGDLTQAEEVLHPLRTFGTPLIDLIGPRPYVQLQTMFDALVPHGWHYYWKSCDVADLSDDVVAGLVENTESITSTRSYTLVFQLGGAVDRVAADTTAYAHRGAGYAVNINAAWLPGDPRADDHVAWARRMFAAVERESVGVYVNFLGAEGDVRTQSAYGAATWRRLREIKGAHDPANLFCGNQNIPP